MGRQNGNALGFTSDDSLRDDDDLVLEALQQNGVALRFASDRIRDDYDLVMDAVRNNGKALAYASESLRAQGPIVLEAVKQTWEAAQFATVVGPMAMEEAVRQDWQALEHIGWKSRAKFENVRGGGVRQKSVEPPISLTDDELASLATINPRIVQDWRVRDCREAVLAAVQHDGLMLQHAVPALRDDKEVVAEAVRQRPEALGFASVRMQEDEDLLVIAVGDRRHLGPPLECLPPLPLAKTKPLVPKEPEGALPAGFKFLADGEEEPSTNG